MPLNFSKFFEILRRRSYHFIRGGRDFKVSSVFSQCLENFEVLPSYIQAKFCIRLFVRERGGGRTHALKAEK